LICFVSLTLTPLHNYFVEVKCYDNYQLRSFRPEDQISPQKTKRTKSTPATAAGTTMTTPLTSSQEASFKEPLPTATSQPRTSSTSNLCVDTDNDDDDDTSSVAQSISEE
jgi:hypothetical protein